MSRISVVIPVWNGVAHLPACLESLLRCAPDEHELEIVAVDNASGDGSAGLIEHAYPQVRLLRNTENEGFAGGCNRGLRAAEGDILILVNQDTQVKAGWFDAVVAALCDPGVGIVGCKILYPDSMVIQHAGGWIEWPLGLSHHRGQGKTDVGQWDQDRDVDFVTGAGLATRRDVLDRVGLLDADFWPGYFEDADLCLRVAEAGYAVRYVADAVMAHVESTSVSDPVKLAEAYQCGRLRFVQKHLPPERWLAEFVPAERAYQPDFIASSQHAALHVAYQSALLAAPALLSERWNASQAVIAQVGASLEWLAQQAWSLEQAALSGGSRSVTPPTVGTRSPLWYNAASRRSARRLAQQRQAANRRQAGLIHALQRQVEMLNRALADDRAGGATALVAPPAQRLSDGPVTAMPRSKPADVHTPTPAEPIPDDIIEIQDPEIDPEAIMERIRSRIQQRRAELGVDDPVFPVFGGAPYPPAPQDVAYDVDLRHYLRLANESFADIETEPVLAPSPTTRIPVLGRLWQLIRGGAHQLVLFYVNRAAAHQTGVNRHLVSALNRMTVVVEQQQRTIDRLQAEVEALRQQVK